MQVQCGYETCSYNRLGVCARDTIDLIVPGWIAKAKTDGIYCDHVDAEQPIDCLDFTTKKLDREPGMVDTRVSCPYLECLNNKNGVCMTDNIMLAPVQIEELLQELITHSVPYEQGAGLLECLDSPHLLITKCPVCGVSAEFLTIHETNNSKFGGSAQSRFIRCSNCGSDYHHMAIKPFVRVKMTLDEYNVLKTKFL